MQGWRRNMEDAHLVEGHPKEEGGAQPGVSVFGVFDGHGGPEVAKFCEAHLARELFLMEDFPLSVKESLVKVFHKIDEMLRDVSYMEELEKLRQKPDEDEAACEGAGPHSPADTVLKHLSLMKKMVFVNPGGKGCQGTGQSGANGGVLGPSASAVAEIGVHAGCTAIVAVRKGNQLFVANAGDSRGVLCKGTSAVALSEDHKPGMEQEKNRIVAAGGFLSEIGGMFRVNGNLNLSRAIGDLKYKTNAKLKPKEQIITAEPDVRVIDLHPEDKFFVLACDGVWDVMDNQQVVNFVSERLGKGKQLSEIGSELLDQCLAPDPKLTRGVGCDNMTILIGELEHNSCIHDSSPDAV